MKVTPIIIVVIVIAALGFGLWWMSQGERASQEDLIDSESAAIDQLDQAVRDDAADQAIAAGWAVILDDLGMNESGVTAAAALDEVALQGESAAIEGIESDLTADDADAASVSNFATYNNDITY